MLAEICNRADKVLVVDDEEAIRKLVHRILTETDYEVVTASDGHEALNIVGQGNVGVVILDIKMPGLSGMEVLQKLAVDCPDIFVIIMTGVADTETVVEAMNLGAYDYITKPLKRDDLVLSVQRALEIRNIKLESEQPAAITEE